MAIEVEHPKKGKVRMVGNPAKMNGTPINYHSAPPLLGEHSESILQSVGYNADQIKTLTESGVI